MQFALSPCALVSSHAKTKASPDDWPGFDFTAVLGLLAIAILLSLIPLIPLLSLGRPLLHILLALILSLVLSLVLALIAALLTALIALILLIALLFRTIVHNVNPPSAFDGFSCRWAACHAESPAFL